MNVLCLLLLRDIKRHLLHVILPLIWKQIVQYPRCPPRKIKPWPISSIKVTHLIRKVNPYPEGTVFISVSSLGLYRSQSRSFNSNAHGYSASCVKVAIFSSIYYKVQVIRILPRFLFEYPCQKALSQKKYFLHIPPTKIALTTMPASNAKVMLTIYNNIRRNYHRNFECITHFTIPLLSAIFGLYPSVSQFRVIKSAKVLNTIHIFSFFALSKACQMLYEMLRHSPSTFSKTSDRLLQPHTCSTLKYFSSPLNSNKIFTGEPEEELPLLHGKQMKFKRRVKVLFKEKIIDF